MIQGSLTHRLMLAMLVGLTLVFLTQVMTRSEIEVPALIQLERELDQRDVGRARIALQQRVTEIVTISADYSVWDYTYSFVQSPPGSDVFENYINANLVYSTFENYKINGFIFFDRDAELHHFSSHDITSGKQLDIQPFDDGALRNSILRASQIPSQFSRVELVNAGLFGSHVGPVIFSTVDILPSDAVGEPMGYVVAWRWLDERFMQAIEKQLQRSITFHPIEFARSNPVLASYLIRLETLDDDAILDRNEDGDLYWLVRSVDSKSLFLVRQSAAERLFNTSWASYSVLVGFGVSALVLLTIAYLFSRIVIRPLESNGRVLQAISANKDYSGRLETGNVDEISRLFDHVNELLICIQTQESELRERNKHLEVLSKEDGLTGIANRRHLDDHLESAWTKAIESQHAVSICLVDIDRFKLFNDHYGHQSGDRVIRQVAQCLSSNLHAATDFLARYGGEEFCVVLSKTDCASAVRVCERLRRIVEALDISHEYSDTGSVLTVSIGVASCIPNQQSSLNELMNKSDQALYEAKSQGRNRVCCYRSD